MTRTAFAAALAALLIAGSAGASPLTYRPINPSFGGNPFNSDHLLATAQQQKQFEESRRSFQRDPIADFTADLERRLLSEVARDITGAIFGENPQDSGQFEVGGTTINFERIGDEVLINLTDGASETSITLPAPQF
ncbi:curli production assembly/transport component CsgF [Limimonas halophila]|uniref:Curli production assembly/transport component CsgF n=1 Tax=Limimonas halophila TaxID=1082479 RepID=A0A1G7RHF3_9PROT|nr:curli assembly protein CsgF [Limimonas halophila]SDG09569.1 curli production assembly/transport component CsgF [Limimonas halophila]